MFRKIVNLTLVLTFFCIFLTSVFLYLSPYARVAAWADWTIFGLTRDRLIDVHVTMGFFLLLLGALHLLLDWRSILESLRSEDGEFEALNRPLLASVALTLFVFVGTLLGLPPMAQILDTSTAIKDSLSETYGEPPYGHAELTPLDEFCRRFGIDLERAKAALAQKNIRLASTEQTLKDIAKDNGLAPGGVYEALKHAWEASRTVTVPSTSAPAQIQPPRLLTSVVLPSDPPPGLGKRRLSDICEEYGLDLARMTDKLKAGGIDAPASMTLKEIADKNGLLPIDVYESLRSDTPIKRPAQTQAQKPVQTPVQTPAQAQAPAQAPVQTPPPAAAQPQATAQPFIPAQTQKPFQPQAQAPALVPGQVPALTPGQPAPQTPGQVPIQTPGQVPVQSFPQTANQFPAQTGILPQETWQPGLERPASPAQSGLVVPPPDLEKTMLSTFCREFDLPLTLAVDRLGAKGITAFGDMTFQELALENNVTPDEVMRIILTP
ncbi:DUF4405 domain-containing protein [Desulfovibrio sulfodismutans]|uniref:DUF4405 domain-containing protein n=1 Tax=Desulfolutivibrio sulfodismutans TaxID=63561 RepID=A0A7K3NKW9_9BACT|nr:DUF4405 domain-containing protein [Desulfolutivibrio sulfodismutans]NDY56846.1 DUF4405 domain-containing protein [Desulfolutivibrio sulfodismutans]